MKAVTVSRIARVIIAISVVIIIAIPAYGGLQSYQMSGTNFVEVESTYQVDNMTESNLESNISTVVGNSDEYKIVYGDVIDTVKSSDLSNLAHTIKTSGAKTATLLDKDGKIATQQTIIGSNGLNQYIYTGLKLSSGLVKTVTPTVDINARTPNGIDKISNVEITGEGDRYNLIIELPVIAVASAMCLDSAINLDVGISYSNFFKADIQLDLPASMFKSESSTPLPEPIISEDQKEIQINSGISVPENVKADVGGVSIDIQTNGDVYIKSADVKIIDALRASLEKDGKLILNIEGKDPVTIEKDTAESVIDMLDQIIKKKAAA